MMHSINNRGLSAQPISAAQSWNNKIQQQEKEAGKLRQAAQMFEAQFVKMMMSEMRNTLSNKSLTSGGFGEEMFTSSLDEARADLIVQGRSIGISDMLEKQLQQGSYTRPAQFRMNSQPAQASGQTTVNHSALNHTAAAAYTAQISAGADKAAPQAQEPVHNDNTLNKHGEMLNASHTPMMARYAEMKNGPEVVANEPGETGAAMLWPVNSTVSSNFGMRFHPILKTNRFHSGMDIQAPSGTPIQAAAEGQVIFAGNRGQLGKTVIVEHADGRQTVYGHCSRLMVQVGQSVEQGQIVGKVGRTGRTTGPHLHFEVRDSEGKATNPMLSLAPQETNSIMLAKNESQDAS